MRGPSHNLVPNVVVPVNVTVAPSLSLVRSKVTPAGTCNDEMTTLEQELTSVPLTYVPVRVQPAGVGAEELGVGFFVGTSVGVSVGLPYLVWVS
ncbi:hypothetical protein Ae201684P_020390 [Aphanomyces euteiches]|nr:hypothetical protein Ae201684P_020390 [Aphanomyces euteiches]